jgi:hypothetical protein
MILSIGSSARSKRSTFQAASGRIQRSFGGFSASPTSAAPVGDVPNRYPSPQPMSEPLVIIVFGVLVSVAAFVPWRVSSSAMPPVRNPRPITRAQRRVLLVCGVAFTVLGVLRLLTS